MLRFLMLLSCTLALVSGFASPSAFAHSAATRSSAVQMASALRTNDVVKVISGDDKVRGAVPHAAARAAPWRGFYLFAPAHPSFCLRAQGTVGKLLMVDAKKGKVVVEGVNIQTKHVKPMKEGESGSILKREAAIHISKVKITDEAPPAAAEASE